MLPNMKRSKMLKKLTILIITLTLGANSLLAGDGSALKVYFNGKEVVVSPTLPSQDSKNIEKNSKKECFWLFLFDSDD